MFVRTRRRAPSIASIVRAKIRALIGAVRPLELAGWTPEQLVRHVMEQNVIIQDQRAQIRNLQHALNANPIRCSLCQWDRIIPLAEEKEAAREASQKV